MNRPIWINAALAVGVFGAFVAAMWYFAWRPARIIDAKNGFSIRFTAEWEVAGEGEGATLRALRTMGVAQGGGSGVINVLVSPIANIPDAAAYRAWFVEHMARKFPGFARIQEGTREIAGLPAPWILYVHRIDPGDLRAQVWQFFFVRESRGYIVTCTAAPMHFENFRADFEESVDSFKFE
jgi:photosystem II reaction center protein PsbP